MVACGVLVLLVSVSVTTVPDRNNLRQQRFLLAHGFKGFQSMMVEKGMLEQVVHVAQRLFRSQQHKKGEAVSDG